MSYILSRYPKSFCALVAVCALAVFCRWSAGGKLPENLAPAAKASATSEHNSQYLAKFATDGKIPPADSGAADRGAAWCVLKAESGDKAGFSLEWPKPVTIREIVYFGRTAWYMTECWKDYEVYLDDAGQPAAKGRFKAEHGPQRIRIPAKKAGKLTLKFLSSYGGPNPGASEIMVFPRRTLKSALMKHVRDENPRSFPKYAADDMVDYRALGDLVRHLKQQHPQRYDNAEIHLERLEKLRKARDEADVQGDELRLEQINEQLASLSKDILLFDIDRLLVLRRHEITASHVYTYHYEGFRPGGGLYVVSPRDPDAEPRLLVETPEGQILDCDLSYDGKTVLFSWRQTRDDGYHLWTINVDGSGLRQITEGEWHDYNPCWLPDGGIAFLSSRAPQFAYCWHAPVGILYRMDADGSNVRKLSANYLNDFTPNVLNDGRIIYSRWEYVDKPAIPIQSLWTINPDGTGLSGYFGNGVLTPGTFMEARSLPGTQKIICTMTGHNGPTRGAIGIIDRSKGVNAQAAIRNITPDVRMAPVDKGTGNTPEPKPYSCPYPLDDRRFLVSARGPVLARTYEGDVQAVALEKPGGMQYFGARPVRPRRKPLIIPNSLPEEADNFATIFLQDIYIGLEPQVKRGEVKRLRVVRELEKAVRIDPKYRAFGFQFPVISCGATYAGKKVLGEVPVSEDGSVAFRVPAGIPLYFMALDAQGRAVQRMRSFTHFMPGETQSCIGCHENRQRVAGPKKGDANTKTPLELEPPEWGVRGFDYADIVQPVLDKNCTACHHSLDPPRGLDLTGGKTDYFNVSYDCLARENQGREGSPYVSWIPTYNGHEQNILKVEPKTWGSPASKLADVVISGHLDNDGFPRHDLKDFERRRILAWIDLNVPYYGSSETAYPDKRGCRRLYPKGLDAALADVVERRCADCHKKGEIPKRPWVRITEPQYNPFLTAPLALNAGGSGKCGKAVFKTKNDPDYRKLLATFKPIQKMLANTPRMDMPGGKPAPELCRDCQ